MCLRLVACRRPIATQYVPHLAVVRQGSVSALVRAPTAGKRLAKSSEFWVFSSLFLVFLGTANAAVSSIYLAAAGL